MSAVAVERVEHCTRCGQPVEHARAAWLELDTRTNLYQEPGQVPDGQSQGLFPFGAACARVVAQSDGRVPPPATRVRRGDCVGYEISVSLHAVGLSWPKNRPYINQCHGSGFGASSEAEALADAQRHVEHCRGRIGFDGGVAIELRRFCRVCDVSGIKPGCKRKRCEACDGRGAVPFNVFVVLWEGVEP